jgi:hypothetical protein
MACEDDVSGGLLMMTQGWTAGLPHAASVLSSASHDLQRWRSMLPGAGPRLQKAVIQKTTMSSPDPSDDLFDSYEPWDPYVGSSQQQTQANQLKLCQLLCYDPGTHGLSRD